MEEDVVKMIEVELGAIGEAEINKFLERCGERTRVLPSPQ